MYTHPIVWFKTNNKFTYTRHHGCVSNRGPFYEHGLSVIPACISNHIPSILWDEITYSFPNLNGCTVEVWEWISNHILRIETENTLRITDTTICFEPHGISGDSSYSLCDGHADVASSGADTTFIANDVENNLPLKDMKQFKSKHPKNLIVSHYNVNSIRNKIYEILPLLHDHLVDILAIA